MQGGIEILSYRLREQMFRSGNAACPLHTRCRQGLATAISGLVYDADEPQSADRRGRTLIGIELTVDNFADYCSGTPTFLTSPSALHPEIKGMTSAAETYEWVVNYVGACPPATKWMLT